MSKIIDLEQKLLNFSNIIDDLDLIEVNTEDPHKTQLMIQGLKTIYQAKFDILWESFEELTKEFYGGKSTDTTN